MVKGEGKVETVPDLTGKVALVTGAQGLGFANTIPRPGGGGGVLADINGPGGKAAESRSGGRTSSPAVDVTSSEQIRMVARTLKNSADRHPRHNG